jgi:hypothetical protein
MSQKRRLGNFVQGGAFKGTNSKLGPLHNRFGHGVCPAHEERIPGDHHAIRCVISRAQTNEIRYRSGPRRCGFTARAESLPGAATSSVSKDHVSPVDGKQFYKEPVLGKRTLLADGQ